MTKTSYTIQISKGGVWEFADFEFDLEAAQTKCRQARRWGFIARIVNDAGKVLDY